LGRVTLGIGTLALLVSIVVEEALLVAGGALAFAVLAQLGRELKIFLEDWRK
jgi:hypothetical protein